MFKNEKKNKKSLFHLSIYFKRIYFINSHFAFGILQWVFNLAFFWLNYKSRYYFTSHALFMYVKDFLITKQCRYEVYIFIKFIHIYRFKSLCIILLSDDIPYLLTSSTNTDRFKPVFLNCCNAKSFSIQILKWTPP